METSSSSGQASSSSSVGKGTFPAPPPPPANLCATINICRYLVPLAKLIVLAQPLDDACNEVEREAFVALQHILSVIESSPTEAVNVFPLLEKLCRYMGMNFREFEAKDTCLIWDLFIKLITTVIPPLREIFMGRQRLSINEKAWENLVTRCVSAHFTSSLQSLEDFIRSTLSQIDENYYEDFDQFTHGKSTEQMLKFNASIVARAPEVLAFTIDSAHLPPTSRLFEVSGKASSKAKAPTHIKFPQSFNLSMRHDAKGAGEEDAIPNIYDLSAVVVLEGPTFETVQAYYRTTQNEQTQWFRGVDGNYELVDGSRAVERNYFNANDAKKVHPRLLVYTKRGISNILELLREYVTKAGQLRMKGDATFAAAQTPENYDEAKQLYEDAIKYDASLRPVLEERLKSLDQIEKNQRAQSYENQADLILGKKKFKEASDLYKLAMRSAVPNSSIFKRIKEKEEFMTRIISLEIANHLTEKGEECLRNGSLQQSRENFAHALKMNPSYVHLHSIITGIDRLITAQTSQQKITEAHQCMKVGRYRQANQLFLEALALVPEKEGSLKPVLESLVVLMQGEDALMKQRSGLVALEDKKYPLAIQLITEAIALLPKESVTEHAFFLCDRAQVFYEMKDYPTSIADCLAALELRPELAVAYLRLGSAQFELELYDEALLSYEKAMRYDPSMADQVRVKIRQVNTAKEIQQRKEREAERARIKEEQQRLIEEKRAREEKLRKEKAEKAAQEQAERCERTLMKEEEKRMLALLQRDDPFDAAAGKAKGKDSAKDKGSKKDKAEKEREKAAEKERQKAEKERERERVKAEKEAKLREEQHAKEEQLRKQREFEAEVAKATAKLKEAERERELERERARIERDRLIAEREKARQEKKAAEQKKAKEEQEAAKELERVQEAKAAASAAATPAKAKTAAAALMQGTPSAAKVVAAAAAAAPPAVAAAPAKPSGDAEFPTLGGGSAAAKKEPAVAVVAAAKKPATPATKWAALVSSKEAEEADAKATAAAAQPAPATTPAPAPTVAAASVTAPTNVSRSVTAPVVASAAPPAPRRTTSSAAKGPAEEFPPLREGAASVPGSAAKAPRDADAAFAAAPLDGDARRSGASAFDTTGVPPLSGLQATSLPFVPTSFTPVAPAPPAAPVVVSVPTTPAAASNPLPAPSGLLGSTSKALSFGFGLDSPARGASDGSAVAGLPSFTNFGAGADSLLGGLDAAASSSFGALFGSSSTSTGTDDFSLLGGSSAYGGLGGFGLGASDSLASFPLGASDFDFSRLTEPGTAVNGLEGSRLMSLGIASAGAGEIGGESLFKLAGPSSKSPDIFGAVSSEPLGQSLLGSLGAQHVDLSMPSGLSDVGGLGLGGDVFGSGLGSLLGSGIGAGLSPLRGSSGQWSGLANGHSSLPAAQTSSSLFGALGGGLDGGLGGALGGVAPGLGAAPGLSGLLPRGTSGAASKDLRELKRKLEDERITDFTLFPAMSALQQLCGAQLYRWAFDGKEWVQFALSLSRLGDAEFRRAYEVLEKLCEVKTVVENRESLIVLTRGQTGHAGNIFMKQAMDSLAQLLPGILAASQSSASRWASGAPQSLSPADQLSASPVLDAAAAPAPAAPVEPEPAPAPSSRRSSAAPTPNTSGKNNGKSGGSSAAAATAAAAAASSASQPAAATSLSALPMAAKPRPAPLKVSNGGGQVRRFVEIPADMIGLVIGANGKNIKELMAESAAKVQFKTAKTPDREGKPGILELCGSADACDRALQLVWNLLQTVQREYREVTAQAAAKVTR